MVARLLSQSGPMADLPVPHARRRGLEAARGVRELRFPRAHVGSSAPKILIALAVAVRDVQERILAILDHSTSGRGKSNTMHNNVLGICGIQQARNELAQHDRRPTYSIAAQNVRYCR